MHFYLLPQKYLLFNEALAPCIAEIVWGSTFFNHALIVWSTDDTIYHYSAIILQSAIYNFSDAPIYI